MSLKELVCYVACWYTQTSSRLLGELYHSGRGTATWTVPGTTGTTVSLPRILQSISTSSLWPNGVKLVGRRCRSPGPCFTLDADSSPSSLTSPPQLYHPPCEQPLHHGFDFQPQPFMRCCRRADCPSFSFLRCERGCHERQMLGMKRSTKTSHVIADFDLPAFVELIDKCSHSSLVISISNTSISTFQSTHSPTNRHTSRPYTSSDLIIT